MGGSRNGSRFFVACLYAEFGISLCASYAFVFHAPPAFPFR
jgi:hypothetical protein